MNTFSITDSYKRAWGLFKANKKVLVLSTVIFMFFGGVGNSGHSERFHYTFYPIWVILIVIFFLVVSLLIKIGFFKVLLKIEDRQATSLKELFKYGYLIWKFFLAYLVLGLLVLAGTIALFFPGIYFAIKYQFVPLLVIDKNLSIRDAFKESAHMTRGVKWHLVGFGLVMGLTFILGACALIIGLLATVPVSFLAYVHVYRMLSKTVDPQSHILPLTPDLTPSS